ncbi:PREDICTED: uncharacterized protein LOC104811458 [Tarenaya hassleriana]|uniref:uncharacterized protein LOC104811458 n=1 Tax=Tarenaya hassleriana TaxID=28532 RepID=UPI00053C73C3|nr:PREDICTED: uncharacterized protein LOC104811458 [Tarenaya hassleriana]
MASHVRSSSWPEDVHPLTRAIQDHLQKLTQTHSTCQKLGVLKSLYEAVDDFLHFPMNTLEDSTHLEDVSDGFLRVLDICSIARDVFLQMKEHVTDLESALRRRSSLGDGYLVGFISKRRAMRRRVERDVKPMMKRNEKKTYDNVLRQVEESSFEVISSLLITSKARSGRGFVSKMFRPKKVECIEAKTDEIGLSEDELERMKRGNISVAEELQRLKETEMGIEEVERGLEGVYKKLVRTRVSLLNILTN